MADAQTNAAAERSLDAHRGIGAAEAAQASWREATGRMTHRVVLLDEAGGILRLWQARFDGPPGVAAVRIEPIEAKEPPLVLASQQPSRPDAPTEQLPLPSRMFDWLVFIYAAGAIFLTLLTSGRSRGWW